jgi:hypothetical protein
MPIIKKKTPPGASCCTQNARGCLNFLKTKKLDLACRVPGTQLLDFEVEDVNLDTGWIGIWCCSKKYQAGGAHRRQLVRGGGRARPRAPGDQA